MIITSNEELSMYVPNHLLSDISTISAFVEQAETSFIMPVLGKPLYDRLITEYKAIIESSVSALLPSSTEEPTAWVKLIKAVQCAAVFYALSDSAGMITLSISDSGLFQVSTGGMEPVADATIAEFKKTAKSKAYQAKDQLYILLEEDATAEAPAYAALWKQSRSYSITKGRLITTAVQFNRYVDIYENREKFVSLLPHINFCEDIYIRRELGNDLVKALITKQTDGKLTDIQQGVVDKLQMALALFVEDRSKLFNRAEAKNEAYTLLNLAIKDIKDNQSDFLPDITSSPLYIDPNAVPVTSSAWVNNKRGDQIFAGPAPL